MGILNSTYYNFIRLNDVGPEVKNWASTDANWELTGLLHKRQEGHHHNAATPMSYPGYNVLNPATPATPVITEYSTGGSLAAGTNVGIRLAFTDQYGLETESSPETFVQLPPVTLRPNAPTAIVVASTPVPDALPGGTFVYALTKRQATGESQISDVITVDVPFDQTGLNSYTVQLGFDPLSAYSDGTDSILIYRTTGFDTNFVLLNTFTLVQGQNSVSTYTDDGTIQDDSHQPPQVSQFGNQNYLNIDWSNIQIPSSAYRMRIYLTQQTGIWGDSALFQDYLIVNAATPFPTNVSYYGTETLQAGYPGDYTQIPFGADKLNLTSEAIGAPIYTQPADAMGYQTWNFIFPDQNRATPIFGAAYVDSSIAGAGQLKVCLSTPNNIGIFTTLAAVGTGYAHPLLESGGHTASHIQGAPSIGGPTQDLINNIISTPVAGPAAKYRIQATSIYKVTATPTDETLSLQTGSGNLGQWITPTVIGGLRDMTTVAQWPTGISPDFPGQWFEANIQTNCLVSAFTTTGEQVSAALAINGNLMRETWTTVGGQHVKQGAGTAYDQLAFNFATPLCRSNNLFEVWWMLSTGGKVTSLGGNVAGQQPQRYFLIKELF